ncbi:MAG: arylsulfatase A, partial [Planctomycetaceae bacterium]|nr:arylsulfatase A [Planctomycetaceae bacterium]
RTQQYKLYPEGGFFEVPEDLEESNDLNESSLSKGASLEKKMLTTVLGKAPPAPTEPGSRTTVNRPTYADWPCIAH